MLTDATAPASSEAGRSGRHQAILGERLPAVPVPIVLVACAAGLAVRVALLRGHVGVVDSDEAVVGLMARHFLRGDFRAFFWGQHYGGTLETVVTAALFWVFGSSVAALKAVPLLFDGAAALLLWRVGRRLVTPQVAVAAGLLMWIWPANYIWWSIKSRGFYQVTLCLTLLGVLLLLRIVSDPTTHHWRDWVGLGLTAGLAWWQTPQSVYILAPAGLWAAWHLRTRAWRVVAAVPGALVGALPWLWANVGHGFPSLTPPPAAVPGDYLSHLRTFATTGLPMTLGLRVVYNTHDIGPPWLAAVLYGAAVVAVVYGCARRWPGGRLAALVIVAYPFIHSVLTLSGLVAEGRYTLLLLPWLALALAWAAGRRAAAALLGVVAVSVCAAGIVDLRGQTSPYAPDVRMPYSVAPLVRSLDTHGVTRAWSNYWIAYRLTFETRERIVAAPTLNDRFDAYHREVADATRPAFVFLAKSRDVTAFVHGLEGAGIRYDSWTAGSDWVVYVPSSRVQPTQFPGSYT